MDILLILVACPKSIVHTASGDYLNELSCLYSHLFGDTGQLNGCIPHRIFVDNAMKAASLAMTSALRAAPFIEPESALNQTAHWAVVR
jgi:hypothetical protein